MIKKEWSKLFKNWWLIIVVIAITLIPSIYSGIFLGSIWDPYGNTNEIPVAVVNHDNEVKFNNQKLNIGKELATNLQNSKSMNFKLVNENKAIQGLEKGDYYMIITIPKDFSKNATTLLEPQPQKMILDYKTNPGTSYIASKMDDSAIAKIKEEVSSTVTKTYAKTLFEQLNTIALAMEKASDGSNEINDGSSQLVAGSSLINDNLKTLAASTLTFNDGANTLNYGLQTYLDGVVSLNEGSESLNDGLAVLDKNSQNLINGSNQISNGIKQLENGSNQLQTALIDAKNNLDTQLNEQTENSIKTLITPDPKTNKNILETLDDSIQTLNKTLTSSNNNPSNPNLNDYFSIVTNKLEENNQSINELNETYLQTIENVLSDNQGKTLDQETINQIITNINNEQKIKDVNTKIITANNTAKTTINSILNNLQQTVSKLNSTTSKVLPGANQAIKQLYNGIKNIQIGLGDASTSNTLINGASSIYQGSRNLYTGASTLNNGLNTYCLGVTSASKGANQLFEGTNQIVSNNSTIKNGSSALANGAKQISLGANQLSSGANILNDGLISLHDGTNTLSNSLEDGAKQISSIKSTEDTYDMMASPVKTSHQEISKVENNGHGMAPYMMSVGLYVAAMAFTLIYPMYDNLSDATSAVKYWLSKATVWFSVSSLAAIIMIGSLIIFCDFKPQQLLITFIFAIVVSGALMSLITLLSSVCGKIGEFILLVFMVINLGASAGTYPLETSSTIFKIIHPFVPFTYSVDGFRKAISMTNASFNIELTIFIAIIIICSLLTILVYKYRIHKPTPLIPQAFQNVNE